VSKFHWGSLGQLQRSLQTDCAGSWERKEQRAAISCTVPMRVWFPSTMLQPMYSSNWRKSKRPLATRVPATTAICCCCLPFILSNLFRDEVEEHNSHHRGNPVVDPSEELIGVTNVFLRWYKLFRQTTPGKTGAEINILRSLSDRHVLFYSHYINYIIIGILSIMHYIIILLHYIIDIIVSFQVVGPIQNRFSIPQQVEPPYHGHRKGSFYQALSC
jgi:hypothetical protein